MRADIPRGRQTRRPVARAEARASAMRDALANHLPELVRESNRLLSHLQSQTAITLTPPEKISYRKVAKVAERGYDGEVITLGVKLNEKQVIEPQHFLNEARLTAVALAIYLASARLTRSGRPGVMVLDDVLIGLDLSNRIPLLQLLQSEFADWQVLLLTHDHTWFELASEYTKASGQWICREMFLVEPDTGGMGRPDPTKEIIALRFADTELFDQSFPGAEAKALGIRNNFTSPVKVPETAFAEIYRHGMRLPVQT